MGSAWVYIVTNRPNGIIYTGVTIDIARRAWERREGAAAGFARRYGLKRTWKVLLILATNPEWHDLYDQIL